MSNTISFPNVPWHTINLTSKIERVHNLDHEKRSSCGKMDPQLKEACAELESLFIYSLLKEMRATIPKTGFTGGGKAEEMFTSMLDSQLAKELASKGGIGLSSIILNQLGSRPEHVDDKNTEKKD